MWRWIRFIVAGLIPLVAFHGVEAAQRTSVALTVAAGPSDRQLAETLIVLVEANVLEDDSLTVVERRQIDLALQELALSRNRSAEQLLQLGKLAAADVIVMLELQAAKGDDKSKPTALLRVVEAKTAAIRGVTAVSELSEANLEEAAEQFARYVSAVVRESNQPTITLVVAPFESVGRFDRLRPLELGIRDLVTSRLLRRMGTLARPSDEPQGTGKSAHPTFQVLQRSNLELLLRELDLVQSGLADKDRLPRTLPDREAAFLIKNATPRFTVTSSRKPVGTPSRPTAMKPNHAEPITPSTNHSTS